MQHVTHIVPLLHTQDILRPAAYALERGDRGYERYFEDNEENRYIWSENSVRGILRSPVYAGHLVGYKRPAVSMKSRKRLSRLPEEWEVIPNTHEAIISQDVFDTVQKLITGRRKKNDSGYDNIFAGVIKCADCGYHLSAGSANRRKRPDIIDCVVYSCGSYTRYGNHTCTSHTLEARDLHNAVISDVNYFAELALRDEKAVKTLQAQISTLTETEGKAFERERRKLQKRAAELDKLFAALYEDRVMERITERNYNLVSAKYEQEQFDNENRLSEIEAELTAKGANQKGIADFLALIRDYRGISERGISELSAATVNALIDRITVSERTKNENGATEQRIKIFYKFVGNLHELYIAVRKPVPHIEEKACSRCGKIYRPGSNVAQFCPVCREAVRKETSARTNDRRREKRGGKPLLPKPCAVCGGIFTPRSHNAVYCPVCYPEAKKQAIRERSREYYHKKKAFAFVGSY